MSLTTRQFRLIRSAALLVAAGLGIHFIAPVGAPTALTASQATARSATTQPAPARDRITGTDPVTVSFAGDANFEDQLRPVAANPDGLATLKPYLSAADITVVNLETAITDRGRRVAGKEFTFRAPASALTALANTGVDVVGMANNHAVDFGADGLTDTLAARAAAPLKTIGIGANESEAFAPAVFTVDGVSVALLNASQLREQTTINHAADADSPGVASAVRPERLLTAVRAAASRYDVVVVFLHWGVERSFCPSAAQTSLTKSLASAGADAIVGGHSHRVQGAGWNGATFVGYSLGNFIWYKDDTFPGRSTGVLTIGIDKARVAARRALPSDRRTEPGAMVTSQTWVPLENNATGIPAPVDDKTAATMQSDRSSRTGCAHLSVKP